MIHYLDKLISQVCSSEIAENWINRIIQLTLTVLLLSQGIAKSRDRFRHEMEAIHMTDQGAKRREFICSIS